MFSSSRPDRLRVKTARRKAFGPVTAPPHWEDALSTGKTKADLESALHAEGLLPRGHLSPDLPCGHAELPATGPLGLPKAWQMEAAGRPHIARGWFTSFHDTCVPGAVTACAPVFSNTPLPSKVQHPFSRAVSK